MDQSYFSFTNLKYDQCALDQQLKESEGPGRWALDTTISESKASCFQKSSPFMHNPFHNAVPVNRIDQESDLRNQNRILSRCPEERFPKNATNAVDYSLTHCETDFLTPEYTRTNKSCNIFSGITINRFHPLCDQIQDVNKIHHNKYIGMNSRLAVKDAFESKK